MREEDIADFKEEGNPLKNKNIVIRNIIIIVIGILIIVFSYLGRQLSQNSTLFDSEQHYSNISIGADTKLSIKALFDAGDYNVIVLGTVNNTYVFDTYNEVTGLKTYSVSEGSLYDTDLAASYVLGFKTEGYKQLSIFMYKMLKPIRVLGFIVVILGGALFFYNPRKQISRENYLQGSAQVKRGYERGVRQ